MVLFNIWWRGILPWLNLQLRPWRPNLSTGPPQELHEWGRHMGAPTLRPMAMRMASLGIRRPSEEIGGAFNHAPDSDEPAPSSRDLEIPSVQCSRRVSNVCWTTGWSQDFWQLTAEGTGVPSGSAHVSTWTEPDLCQDMGWMTGGQGGAAALGLRPHQQMPKRQKVQGWRHFETPGHLISQARLLGAMSLPDQNRCW